MQKICENPREIIKIFRKRWKIKKIYKDFLIN